MAGPCDAPTGNKNGCHSIGHPVLPLPLWWNWRPPHIPNWCIHHLLLLMIVVIPCRRCRVMQSPCSSLFHYVLRWQHIPSSGWLPLHFLTSPTTPPSSPPPPANHPSPSPTPISRVCNLREGSSSSWWLWWWWWWWLLLFLLLLRLLCLFFHPWRVKDECGRRGWMS